MLDLGHAILDLGFWLANSPLPVRVSAALVGPERGVEIAGSALALCGGGAATVTDVTGGALGGGRGDGRRGNPGNWGHAGAI